jgi:hypothetical protein
MDTQQHDHRVLFKRSLKILEGGRKREKDLCFRFHSIFEGNWTRINYLVAIYNEAPVRIRFRK